MELSFLKPLMGARIGCVMNCQGESTHAWAVYSFLWLNFEYESSANLFSRICPSFPALATERQGKRKRSHGKATWEDLIFSAFGELFFPTETNYSRSAGRLLHFAGKKKVRKILPWKLNNITFSKAPLKHCQVPRTLVPLAIGKMQEMSSRY